MNSKNKYPCLDEDFIKRLIQGDYEAWQILMDQVSYDLNQALIASMSLRGVPLESLNDIQDRTWGRAMDLIVDQQRFQDLSNPQNLYRFIRVVGKNIVREEARRLCAVGRRVPLEHITASREGDPDHLSEQNTQSPEQQLIEKQRIAEVFQLFDLCFDEIDLEPHHREIFLACLALGDLTRIPKEDLQSLAEKFNMTISGIRKALKRTQKKVRSWMILKGYITPGGEE